MIDARKDFEMSREQYERLTRETIPRGAYIDKQGNRVFKDHLQLLDEAWNRLGEEMGFHGRSVHKDSTNPRRFNAIAKVTL